MYKVVPCTITPKEFYLGKRDRLPYMTYPAYADVKYDGEYCEADTLQLPSSGMLINGYGKARMGGPILAELPTDSVLYGELYFNKGHNGDLYPLLSNKLSDQLRFAAFDISRLEGRDVTGLAFDARRELLIKAIGYGNGTYTHVVDSYYVESEAEAQDAFNEAVAIGFEGVVIKPAHQGLGFGSACNWVKLKYTLNADLRVAYIDPSKERIECEVPGSPKWCGVKVMNKVKQTLKVGDMVEIQHYGVLNGGGLRHPVYMRKREPNKKVSIDI